MRGFGKNRPLDFLAQWQENPPTESDADAAALAQRAAEACRATVEMRRSH